MAKKLQLSIPKPCHENWDAMTPVEQGKFCGSCQKQVVDFSTMSDRQVAEFFKKPSTGSVCGRFMTDQLERDIEIPKKRIPWLKYFFQFTIPAFLVSLKASPAKAQIGKIKVESVKKDTTPVCTPRMGIIAMPYDRPIGEKGLKGNVVDAASGLSLPQTTVTLVSSIGREPVKVNGDGSFILNYLRKITISAVEFSLPGYESRTISWKDFLGTLNADIHTIRMHREMMLKGEIAVNTCTRPLMGDTVVSNQEPDTTKKVQPQLETGRRVIRGIVTDETGVPLPGVAVIIKGTRTGMASDNNGTFRIVCKTGDVLVASNSGLEPKEVTIGAGDSITIEVRRTPANLYVVTVGAISVKRIRKAKKPVPLMPSTFDKTSPVLFSTFPNPLPSGASLSIEWKGKEEGYYILMLTDQAGRTVHQQEIWIDAEARLLSIQLPAVAAGNYFVVLTDKKTAKKYSEKIIIL